MKIFYTVNTRAKGFPVRYINQQGEETIEDITAYESPGDAMREFKIFHPGAEYLSPYQFALRLDKIKSDKARLARWNAGA